jgi:hypothetical protein
MAQLQLRTIHTHEFDDYGFCPQCTESEYECECPGPWDLFKERSDLEKQQTCHHQNEEVA